MEGCRIFPFILEEISPDYVQMSFLLSLPQIYEPLYSENASLQLSKAFQSESRSYKISELSAT